MKTFSAILLLVTAASAAFGHEFWLEPDSFFLARGQRTALHLYVGESLKKDEERTYQAGKTDGFTLYSNYGTFDMRSLAEDGVAPLITIGGDRDGTYLLSMERNWSNITLDAAKFEDYLKEDGMEYVIAERKRLKESAKDGRERYRRYLKAILQVGSERDATAKRLLGSRLEIVPLDNPYSKKRGDTVRFQVYFSGRTLAGRNVFADNRDGDKYSTQKAETDANGVVTFKIDKTGVWLIRLVHMQRCEKNCGDADWESFWTALTFGVK